MMRAFVSAILISVLCLACTASPSSHFTDQQKEVAIANALRSLELLNSRQYEPFWDEQTSAFFQSRVDRDAFLADLAFSRAELGAQKSAEVLKLEQYAEDPASGYEAPLLSVTLKVAYESGLYYERMVFLEEEDAALKISGIWITPAGS